MRSAPSLRATRQAIILLVDDNAHGLIARRSILEELGYQVVSASTGDEALQLVEQHHFDVIVTDYRMPAMDGVALIAALRKRHFANPIILLSGFLSHLGLTEESTGADLLIQKSNHESDQLVRGVKKLLAAPRKPVTSQPNTQEKAKKAGSNG
ncbi:MAG: response regulator [Bryobacteraceae bacterium]